MNGEKSLPIGTRFTRTLRVIYDVFCEFLLGPDTPGRAPGRESNGRAPADAVSIENEDRPAAEKAIRQLTVTKDTGAAVADAPETKTDSRPGPSDVEKTNARPGPHDADNSGNSGKAKPVPECTNDKDLLFDKVMDEEFQDAQHPANKQQRPAPRRLPDRPKMKRGWILNLEHVFKTYGRGVNCVRALKDVNMTIPRGCMVGIVGPSGSGKSTLLHVVSGMDVPDETEFSHIMYTYYDEGGELKAGEIEYWNSAFMDGYRRSSVGVIFQRPNLFAEMSAWRNAAVSLTAQGHTQREVREKCAEMLEFVNMAENTKRKPSNMSGGEQQRVAVARALVKEPALIVADEPTGNLDKKNTRKIMELLKTAQLKKGSTVILVTHNENLVRTYCDIAYRFTDTGVVGLDRKICSRSSFE